jgi:hypothetical protein
MTLLSVLAEPLCGREKRGKCSRGDAGFEGPIANVAGEASRQIVANIGCDDVASSLTRFKR